jgi:tellurite resistance protein
MARTAILEAPGAVAAATLGAMRAVALEHGGPELTEMDRETIGSAGLIVFGLGEVDVDAIEPVDPAGLASATGGAEEAARAIRMLSVMSLADGEIDAEKTALVRAYADALGVAPDYLDILAEAAADEIAQAAACIVRKNAESFPHLDSSRLSISAVAPFFPYKDAPDPELEARYKTLGDLPADSFGRAFFDHFHKNGFFFPGHPDGLAEGFTTPHDSSHVLSGYSTSELGEICVSTFIGAMHPDHPMAAEVFPVIFSWHLGVKLNDIAHSTTGVFEPAHFWTAWERGSQVTTDVVAPDWDFWAATTVPLEELRVAYGVPGVDPAMLA